MDSLLAFSRTIDWLNEKFGIVADYLVLIACFISAGNATSRYLINLSSNAWLEVQWYMFSGMFLLGASYTLKKNEHVRVDLVYANVSERMRLYIDIGGLVLFLLPAMTMLILMTWPFFLDSWFRNETSANAGGLIRWPVKILMPVGFALITLQGLSELIKRFAALQGRITIETKYEKPQQ